MVGSPASRASRPTSVGIGEEHTLVSIARTPLEWTDLDRRAVDTCRVLAMDAVQKVGNGHPGTAMALAPVAYTLFQKKMRHNPADPAWPAGTLSCSPPATAASPSTPSSSSVASASSSTT